MAISEGTILRVVASLLFPDNVIMQNVFHLVLTSAGGSDAEDDVVSDMVDYLEEIWTEVLIRFNDGVLTDEVKVYEYDPIDDDFDEVGTSSFDVTFTDPSNMLPHGAALVVNLYTLDPDVQGRKFFGGIHTDKQLDGLFTAATLLDFLDAAAVIVTQFVGAATGATFTCGVWSPTETNFFAYNGVVAANAVVGYQRRRKPGVGI